MIEIDKISKRYKGVQALNGFSLRIEQGESVGLVGPNGAGKTTLIKILATLLPMDEGRVEILGIDVATSPIKIRSVIGYLPDVPGIYQDMQVHEFLEFFADAFRLTGQRKQSAVEQALARAGLRERRSTYIEQLSFGMKQRLMLAKTLLHDPKVLLLDEPATGLDPLARIELRETLKRLHQEGLTILISSHILSDLEDTCSRIALIADGKNASDRDGETVLTLGRPTNQNAFCEVDVEGPASGAVPQASAFPGARIISAEGSRLRVELPGGLEQPTAFVQHLIAEGVRLAGFRTAGPDLEERYRRTFGGEAK